DTQASAVAVTANGQIVVAGVALDTGALRFEPFVARFDASGVLDGSFGTNGIVRFFFDAAATNQEIDGMAIDPVTGQIVVAGTVAPTGANEIGVARLNADGTFDWMFGTGGIVVNGFLSGLNQATAVALQHDGSIDVAGTLLQGSGTSQQSDFEFVVL